MSRVSAALIFTLAAACGQAPTKTGNDQVHDPNVEITALKDNGLASLEWEIVDNYMKNVIGDPADPGCAVGVARGGKVIYLQGYGKAQIGGEDWSVSTMGAVGSVSKTFTAAGLLLMHQEGTFNLFNLVKAYLPTSNAALANASIPALLTHTSGVGGSTKDASFSPVFIPGTQAQACQTGALTDCGPAARELAEPRLAYTRYAATQKVSTLANGGVYSNVGYSVLGAILDKLALASDDGYEGFIWNRIGGYPASDFDANNMLSLALSHSWRATDIRHRAVGHVKSADGVFSVHEAFAPGAIAKIEGWEGPSGGWMMTIGDLTRFALALNTSQIVDDEMLALMRTPWATLNQLSDHAGMGMLVRPGSQVYWHGGLIGGNTAAWLWTDYEDVAITLMCNRSDILPYDLRDHALELLKKVSGSVPGAAAGYDPGEINKARVDGQSYHLDASTGYQAAPTGAILPLTSLSHDLVVRAQVTNGAVALSLVEADVANGTATRVSTRAPQSLGVATVTNPRFSTPPAEIRLASPVGDVPVHGFTVSGTLEATRLGQIALHGTLDMREIGALVGRTASSMCTELATTDTSCTPCRDGARACVPFAYKQFTGRDVTMP
ncbi:MAG TPA: serine hydrolase domain-containing protein [Kofleriaceae bacterium]|nr:serine hydrolase domain-containing protein [Kofleriaceae bacterium]